MVRQQNEDALAADGNVFLVADGMGGHAGGAVASRLAVQAITSAGSTEHLTEAVKAANELVFRRASTDPATAGMGTTVCCLTFGEGCAMAKVANVGDSRAYLFRGGKVRQITEDHSMVADLERAGHLTAEQAQVHPHRNIITRVVGTSADVAVDVYELACGHGDRFLLCTDGLTNEVSDAAIVDIVRSQVHPQATVDLLVERANSHGGRDNVSAILVEVAATANPDSDSSSTSPSAPCLRA